MTMQTTTYPSCDVCVHLFLFRNFRVLYQSVVVVVVVRF